MVKVRSILEIAGIITGIVFALNVCDYVGTLRRLGEFEPKQNRSVEESSSFEAPCRTARTEIEAYDRSNLPTKILLYGNRLANEQFIAKHLGNRN